MPVTLGVRMPCDLSVRMPRDLSAGPRALRVRASGL